MNLPPTIEEFTALQQALQEANSQRDALAGENRVLRTERDLLKERLEQIHAQDLRRQERSQ
jgi:FtsZ-binding cell division protein ZapB